MMSGSPSAQSCGTLEVARLLLLLLPLPVLLGVGSAPLRCANCCYEIRQGCLGCQADRERLVSRVLALCVRE